MESYLMFIYISDKYPVTLLNVQSSIHGIFKYLSKKINKPIKFWNSLINREDEVEDDIFDEIDEIINKYDHHFSFSISSKYFNDLVSDEYVDLRNARLFDTVSIIIIKTDKNGDFIKYLNKATDYIL